MKNLKRLIRLITSIRRYFDEYYCRAPEAGCFCDECKTVRRVELLKREIETL